MTNLEQKIRYIINALEPEYRSTVTESLNHCDGTLPSFELELTAARWENPRLPVAYIMDLLDQA